MSLHKKRRGRPTGEKVEPPDVVAEFRSQIRDGMNLYGASATDIVDRGDGARVREPGWVWLQLAPSRVLYVYNARELFYLLMNCRKAIDYRLQHCGGGVDPWLQSMLHLLRIRFRFLIPPAPNTPPPMLFSPKNLGTIADSLAEHLERFGPKSKLREHIAQWLAANGGKAGWYFAFCTPFEVARRYQKIPVNGSDLGREEIEAALHRVNDILWEGDEQYELFREEKRKEVEIQ